ncbi:MAG: hypothetical protein ABI386_01175 [Rhodanobacter sp.]
MKTRHVFSTPDLNAAVAAVNELRRVGVPDDDIWVMARDDIENTAVPDDLRDTSGDFGRGGVKGLLGGGGTGLVCGLAAMLVPAISIPLAGAAAMVVAGAAVGGWMGMLTGSSVPDTVRRRFHDELSAGRIIIAVDAEDELLVRADAALLDMGTTQLPYDDATALS